MKFDPVRGPWPEYLPSPDQPFHDWRPDRHAWRINAVQNAGGIEIRTWKPTDEPGVSEGRQVEVTEEDALRFAACLILRTAYVDKAEGRDRGLYKLAAKVARKTRKRSP